MKYMGSKRAMLQNGLGKLLNELVPQHQRFVDLFAGSGAVASYVACSRQLPVLAFDLQAYSVAVAAAVIERTSPENANSIWDRWISEAGEILIAANVPNESWETPSDVFHAREWSQAQARLPVTRAYGGHYFSPLQAVCIDALRIALPKDGMGQKLALASLIRAASQCVAAPGHTAQPFQPTRTALPYLLDAWRRDVFSRTKSILRRLAKEHALSKGNAQINDANHAALELRPGDLAFVDPPYSGVHYSRFYHVLETIALGECGEVSGVGRYPNSDRRPRSRYSLKGQSGVAMDELLERIANAGAAAIVTFPDHDCSNGLSGDQVREIAMRHFCVSQLGVRSKFSTLGGHRVALAGSSGRTARRIANELILVLQPQ